MKKILLLFLLLAGCATQVEHAETDHSMPTGIMKIHAGQNRTLSPHDYTVTFDHDPLIADISVNLTFTFKKGEKPLEVQPTHGMPMHLIVVSKDLDNFYHLHPEEEEPGVFTARQTFEEPGEYRLWLEYTYDNVEHIVDYDITVEEGLRG